MYMACNIVTLKPCIYVVLSLAMIKEIIGSEHSTSTQLCSLLDRIAMDLFPGYIFMYHAHMHAISTFILHELTTACNFLVS